MSKIEVNAIEPQCGTNLTVGASGDTITFPSGTTVVNNGSQTGFGRTGTVNWVTTKKTASFTAVSGEGYFCDTAAVGAFTLTLPSSPSAGNIVGLKDYNGNFGTANLTIGRNSQPINGANAADPLISTNGASIFLVYVDASQGWVATQDDSSTFAGESFIVASGGTVTTCGNCKIHTFTGPGTFTVNGVGSTAADNVVSYVVIAGGGAGGTDAGATSGGGGGAGGFREFKSPVTPYTASPLEGSTPITVTATGYPITVGGGAAAVPVSSPVSNSDGSPSIFSTITSTGGGGGASNTPVLANPNRVGGPGGSGGGASAYNLPGKGTGNTPPVSPAQGTDGGTADNGPAYGSGGGGGATAAGANGTTLAGGNGGAGATTSITGSPVARAGGGGGAAWQDGPPTSAGAGGTGGGGAGGATGGNIGFPATINTGSGGGGASGTPGPGLVGGSGGSGIVIIRYKFQ